MLLDLSPLPERMLSNYVERYEAGGLQPSPRLRFVDEKGRACVAAAMAGARSNAEFARSEAFRSFVGSPLEDLSRAFEARRITASQVYDACLLELARRGSRRAAVAASTATRASRTSPAYATAR